MKKSTKIIRLSVTLLLLIAMLLTPMSPVFAVVIENGDADLTAADIVSEDASKREKFSRHYLTGDGTYFAVSYAEQVNYQDEDGNWIAVDNSLSTNVLTGEKSTKNEKFKVKFANKANKDDLVTIKTKEYDVSFGITVSEDGESYLELNKVKGTENPGNTSAEPKTTQEATSLGKAVSGITYVDAFSDYLDVRYSVAHEKVKEDLILERKSSFNSYKVTYNIKEKDALATLNDDGSITFTSPDGAVLFNVGVPVMYDSDGKSSADIAVSVTQDKKTVEVTYTPASEWLNAEERVYPVTIDPSVFSSQVTSNIIDTSYSVDSNTEEMAISETLYMGQGYSAFIKINQVADVPVGGTLLGADLVLYGDYGYTNNANNVFRFTIFELTETWNEYALSGDDLPERNISNARVYDNPSHQTSIGDDFIQFTFNLSNDLWESDGFNDYFENYNGFEIYLDHNSYFEAHSGEYPTVELRPCIRTRYSVSSINSVNARSAYSLTSENTYGMAAEINTGKEYRLLNDSSKDYVTYSNGSVILSDYIQGSISQKVSFYYDPLTQSYSIMLTDGNEYLYYYVDSEGALTYTVWTTTSVVNDCDRWKIYYSYGYYIIASVYDEQYVLTDANGTLIVTSYAYGDYSQLWSTEIFNSMLINNDENLTLSINDEIVLKTLQNVLSWEVSYTTSPGVVSINNGLITVHKYGYAEIRIETLPQTFIVCINVPIAAGQYYISNDMDGKRFYLNSDNNVALSNNSIKNTNIWNIIYSQSGYYTITNNGKYMTASTQTVGNSNSDLYAVRLETDVNNDSKYWYITSTNNGYKFIPKTDDEAIMIGYQDEDNNATTYSAYYVSSDNVKAVNYIWKLIPHSNDVALLGVLDTRIDTSHDHYSCYSNVMDDIRSTTNFGFNLAHGDSYQPNDIKSMLSQSKIFVFRGHGEIYSTGTQITLTNPQKDSIHRHLKSEDLSLNGTPIIDLSGVELAMYVCCWAGTSTNYDNLLEATTTAGAHYAIGFKISINCDAANVWTTLFFENYTYGDNPNQVNDKIKKAISDYKTYQIDLTDSQYSLFELYNTKIPKSSTEETNLLDLLSEMANNFVCETNSNQ